MFIEFKDSEIISTAYTAYPSRSITLLPFGDPWGGFEKEVFLYDSKSYGVTREFYDTLGNVLTQSYNVNNKVRYLMNHTLTSSEKYSINRLRNIYASASFYNEQNYTSSSVFSASTVSQQSCSVLTIPSFYVGGGIVPGTLNIKLLRSNDNLVSADTQFNDNSYGGLTFSASSNSLVGSIFYEYGLVYFGHEISTTTISGTYNVLAKIYIQFTSSNTIPINMYLCTAPKGAMNFSTNPSYTQLSGTKYEITTKKNKTFITSVFLYDENYELIGVAKTSSPILKQEDESIQFRLKLNF